MKQIKFIMVALVVMQVFVGCKKDDKPEPQPKPKVKKETPLPTEEGIYQGDKKVFAVDFSSVEGDGTGTSVILASDGNNPFQNFVKVTLPTELQQKSLKEVRSIKITGKPQLTLSSTGKTFFNGEMQLTITNVKEKDNLVGIYAVDKDQKEWIIVYLVLEI